MTKKNIMPVVVLTVICLIVAALLAGVNELTKGKIEENILKAEQESLIEVLPGATLFTEIDIPEGAPKTVRKIYRENAGLGHVLIMVAEKTSYSSGDMTVSVGVIDGEIVGAKITTYNESKDVGRESYPEKFVGTNKDTVGTVELVTDVTYSSTAFKAAMADALAAEAMLPGEETVMVFPSFASAGGAALPENENDFKAEIEKLLPGVSYTEEALPEGAPDTLKKLFKTANGGYVCYVVVPGEYVPVATAALFEVKSDGTVGNINLLAWVVGHGVEAGNFEDGFVGTDIYHVDGVELVTGATGTSVDFRGAVSETLNTVTDLLGKRGDRLYVLIKELVPNGVTFTENTIPEGAPQTLKKLYKTSDGGYLCHLIVPGQYVAVATEALFYVSNSGNIESIKLMQWVVGHDVGPGDFEDRFVGTNVYLVDGVELVTGATGTSVDFRGAVSETLNMVTDLLGKREEIFLALVDEIMTNSEGVEKLPLPEGAPKTLKGLYASAEGRGTVAHIVVPGAYVPVATESLVYFDNFGKVRAVNLMQWVVGHGVGPADFTSKLVGKTAAEIEAIDSKTLVTGATGTAGDFKDELLKVFPFVPTKFPVWRAVSITVILLSIAGFVSVIIIKRKRRSSK